MKRSITTTLLSILMILGMTVSFVSCDDDYYDGYGPGGNTFIDRDLNGSWRLYEYNGVPVTGYDVNYMQFNGNGNGRYYYYDRGTLYWEGISYWCKAYGAGDYQLNVQYSNGSSAQMIYWFTSQDDLWLRWNTSSGSQLYHYVYTARIP